MSRREGSFGLAWAPVVAAAVFCTRAFQGGSTHKLMDWPEAPRTTQIGCCTQLYRQLPEFVCFWEHEEIRVDFVAQGLPAADETGWGLPLIVALYKGVTQSPCREKTSTLG